jgi:hypothetical protein
MTKKLLYRCNVCCGDFSESEAGNNIFGIRFQNGIASNIVFCIDSEKHLCVACASVVLKHINKDEKTNPS